MDLLISDVTLKESFDVGDDTIGGPPESILARFVAAVTEGVALDLFPAMCQPEAEGKSKPPDGDIEPDLASSGEQNEESGIVLADEHSSAVGAAIEGGGRGRHLAKVDTS